MTDAFHQPAHAYVTGGSAQEHSWTWLWGKARARSFHRFCQSLLCWGHSLVIGPNKSDFALWRSDLLQMFGCRQLHPSQADSALMGDDGSQTDRCAAMIWLEFLSSLWAMRAGRKLSTRPRRVKAWQRRLVRTGPPSTCRPSKVQTWRPRQRRRAEWLNTLTFTNRGGGEGVSRTPLHACVEVWQSNEIRSPSLLIINISRVCALSMYGAICVCDCSFRAPLQ